MLGNLKIFFGAGEFNGYAHWLRTIGEPVPALRVGAVDRPRGAASPPSSRTPSPRTSSAAATSGRAPGQVRAQAAAGRATRPAPCAGAGSSSRLFIVWHILDLTTGTVHPSGFQPGHPYQNVVATFSTWYGNVIYIVAMLAARPAHPARLLERRPDPRRGQRAPATAPSRPSANVLALVLTRGLRLRTRRRHDRSGELSMTATYAAATRPATPVADTKAPDGPGRRALGHAAASRPSWSTRPTAASTPSSSSAPASPAARPAPPSPNRATTSSSSATRTRPRRAHSIAAQGGINAAKNYRNDGDSVHRLFYDTVKGGDFRARESNVHRLAQISVEIIDQCVAQGVPFAREYGGLLDTRSFGGVQVSRTFYARGQTGQQLLLGAYQALSRQIAAGQRGDAPAHRDARPDRRRRPGPRHRRPRPGHRRGSTPTSPTRSSWPPAATATSSTCRPTP